MVDKLNKILVQELSRSLSKNKVKILEKFYQSVKTKGQQQALEFCLDYTLSKNESLKRKTGLPNEVHCLEVALSAIKYKLSFNCVCAALLHDVIEDEIEVKVEENPQLDNNEKNKLRVHLRRRLFEHLNMAFKKAVVGYNSGILDAAQEIIEIVDILTRYRTSNPHYYYYINSSFGRFNKKFKREVIAKALLLKMIDRKNNIVSMDTELKKMLNNKIKAELKILGLLKSESIRNKYKQTIHTQASLLLDHSFSEGRRLNQIWKNTYLLIKARMYFCYYKLYERTSAARKIEQNLINKTLAVLVNHKNDLKIYLSGDVISYWDHNAKVYTQKGGLDGRTKKYTGVITKDNQYLVFNNTIELFSKLLLKDNEEFRKLQFDKAVQYQYLSVIHELLKKFQADPDFICNLAKKVKIG